MPELAPAVAPADLVVPAGLDFNGYDFALAGEPHRWGDYALGEIIDHVDAVTVEEAEHMMATRLWQNTARVHFDATAREDGRRLIYGGHVISLARALSFNGLANAQMIVALNAGSHANPCFAGDTVTAWSEVLDKAETAGARGGRAAAAAGRGARRHQRRARPGRRGQVPGRGCPARPRLLGADADLTAPGNGRRMAPPGHAARAGAGAGGVITGEGCVITMFAGCAAARKSRPAATLGS